MRPANLFVIAISGTFFGGLSSLGGIAQTPSTPASNTCPTSAPKPPSSTQPPSTQPTRPNPDTPGQGGAVGCIQKLDVGDAPKPPTKSNPDTPGEGGAIGYNHDPEVGGSAMYASKNIIQNAVNSPINKTLVAAVRAAGLVDTLTGPGPFTVFAPTDDAFTKLPSGTVDTLVKPENKDSLLNILTYHVVSGKYTSKQLEKMIRKGGGKATLKTVQGEDLTVSMSGGNLILTDAKGGTATVTTADVIQSNGIIDIIDTVLHP